MAGITIRNIHVSEMKKAYELVRELAIYEKEEEADCSHESEAEDDCGESNETAEQCSRHASEGPEGMRVRLQEDEFIEVEKTSTSSI